MKHKVDLDKLTLREKIGQTVIVLCTTDIFYEKCGNAKNFIEKYPIGGLYPSDKMINGAMKILKTPEFDALVTEFNKYSKIPLITTCDGPNDEGGMMSFGNAMLLGATGDTELAYQYGRSMGDKVSSCGLHWWFEPVVDLNLSPDDPVINVRAISDDVSLTTSIAGAVIKGVQDSGVAATAKHFPGPDDKACIDYHLAPVTNKITKETWEKTNGEVYRRLFEQEVMTVMTTHNDLAWAQTEKINGRFPPTVMSSEVVTDLLKGRLGYEGVVVTDALVMGGFTGAGGLENQVKCLEAGNDVMLWPDLEYIDLVEEKILNGEIPMSRLDDAVNRVLCLKEKLGVLDNSFTRKSYDDEAAKELEKKICEKGITLVKNVKGIIPAADLKKVLIIAVTPDDNSYQALRGLSNSFQKYGITADVQRDIWVDELKEKEKEYDLIVFALSRHVHKPIGPLEFWGKNASSIWASNAGNMDKIVVISFGNPYSYSYYRETDMTYINAYTQTEVMFDTFVKGLIGEIEFVGKSSVKL